MTAPLEEEQLGRYDPDPRFDLALAMENLELHAQQIGAYGREAKRAMDALRAELEYVNDQRTNIQTHALLLQTAARSVLDQYGKRLGVQCKVLRRSRKGKPLTRVGYTYVDQIWATKFCTPLWFILLRPRTFEPFELAHGAVPFQTNQYWGLDCAQLRAAMDPSAPLAPLDNGVFQFFLDAQLNQNLSFTNGFVTTCSYDGYVNRKFLADYLKDVRAFDIKLFTDVLPWTTVSHLLELIANPTLGHPQELIRV